MSVKMKIVCDGDHTVLELDGKAMAKGVKAIHFNHEGGDAATCSIDLDLRAFSFMPSGTFDEACQKFAKAKPPEEQTIGRAEQITS